jgi:ParB/RepB/Spo0J family partition protein
MAPKAPTTFFCAVDLIDVDDQALRHDPEDDSIIELAQDIAQKGLIQPVGVSSKPEGRYQLRWGGRRLAAHKRLRAAQIWARLWERDDISIKALALVENLQRRNMTLAEEVDAVIFMTEAEGKTPDQISASLSKGRSWVLNRLMIPSLPPFLRDALIAGDLGISHVEVIAKVPDPGAQSYLASMAIANRWNTSQLKTIADCYMTPTPQEPAQPAGIKGVNPATVVNPFMYECEVCHEKGTLEKFTLVRVHKDGEGCRTVADRPNQESGRIDGMEGHSDEHRGSGHQATDRETET